MRISPFFRESLLIGGEVFRRHVLERGTHIEGKGDIPKSFQKKSSIS